MTSSIKSFKFNSKQFLDLLLVVSSHCGSSAGLLADSSCSCCFGWSYLIVGCFPLSDLAREPCPALSRQMSWRSKGLYPVGHWSCQRTHLQKTMALTRIPKKTTFKAQMSWFWSWFRNIWRNSCGWQEHVYLFWKEKWWIGRVLRECRLQNRGLFPSSKLGVENNWIKTQLVFKSHSLTGSELRG